MARDGSYLCWEVTRKSSPAGSWSYDAGQNHIEQTNNVRGGLATVGGKKAGAHALLIKDNAAYNVQNFILKANVGPMLRTIGRPKYVRRCRK